MGFFKSISKIIKKTSGIADPVSAVLRKQGGALGTVGAIMNPGATAAGKMAGGAPINARTMLDPNGWVVPTPLPPEAPEEPLPPLGAPGALPPGLMPRAVPYSSAPPNAGLLTQLAYRMAGPPPPNPPGATPYPGMPLPPVMGDPGNASNRIQLPQPPAQVSAQGLPMTDPYTLLRWRGL